jgi:hypothetical protein
MKQRIAILTALSAVALAATAGRASADTRIGIEMGRTLAGYPGLGARLDLGPVQLEGLLSGPLVGNSDAPRAVLGALRVLVPLGRWTDGWIGVMAGVDADNPHAVTAPIVDAPITYTPARSWAVEAGLHVEWFALPALSLGLDLGAVHGAGPAFGAGVDTYTNLGVGTLAGGGTVAFWF